MEQQTVSIRDTAPRYKILWADFLEANGTEYLTIDQNTQVFLARQDYVRFFENTPGLKYTDTSPSVREIRVLLRAEKEAGIVSQAELAEQERVERERVERELVTLPSRLSVFLANLNLPSAESVPVPKRPKSPAPAKPTGQHPRPIAERRERARRLRQYLEEQIQSGINPADSYSVMIPEGMTSRELADMLELPRRRSEHWYFPIPPVWAYNPYPKDCRLDMQRTHRPDRL